MELEFYSHIHYPFGKTFTWDEIKIDMTSLSGNKEKELERSKGAQAN
jgi:hypothetical protein